MMVKLRQMASAQVPGDTQRNLQIHPTYSDQTFKHILVPVWVLAFTYRSKIYQVLVNGYSGQNRRRLSAQRWKIFLLIVVVLIVVVIAIALSQE